MERIRGDESYAADFQKHVDNILEERAAAISENKVPEQGGG